MTLFNPKQIAIDRFRQWLLLLVFIISILSLFALPSSEKMDWIQSRDGKKVYFRIINNLNARFDEWMNH